MRSLTQLAVENAAAALESAVIDFDSPAPDIPLHSLLRMFEGGDFDGGQQHPFNRITIDDVLILFPYVNGPSVNRSAGFQALGRLQLHFGESNIENGVARLAVATMRDMQPARSIHRAGRHEIPQQNTGDFSTGGPVHAHQQSGTVRIAGRLQKQFEDIRFAISDTDQLRIRRCLLNFSYLAETTQPFLAFFLLDGQILAPFAFAFILRVSRPALSIQ